MPKPAKHAKAKHTRRKPAKYVATARGRTAQAVQQVVKIAFPRGAGMPGRYYGGLYGGGGGSSTVVHVHPSDSMGQAGSIAELTRLMAGLGAQRAAGMPVQIHGVGVQAGPEQPEPATPEPEQPEPPEPQGPVPRPRQPRTGGRVPPRVPRRPGAGPGPPPPPTPQQPGAPLYAQRVLRPRRPPTGVGLTNLETRARMADDNRGTGRSQSARAREETVYMRRRGAGGVRPGTRPGVGNAAQAA